MPGRRLQDLVPGDTVRDYVIESVLGQGGFGRVYLAYHPRLRRHVAIKVMGGALDAQSRARFEREAQAVAALRHPSILAVFDFGEVEGEPFMVLEHMPNGTLDSRLEHEPVAPAEAVAMLAPIAEALDAAHRQGVIHRDVKPANVFLDKDLRPVLGDFGLSKMGALESITVSGTVAGTPAYLAPEQAQGKEPTSASDRYALAVMAFELLTGRQPFESASGPLTVLYQHVSQAPPAASEVNVALPVGVDAVLWRGLAKDPAERWPDARGFVAALAQALGLSDSPTLVVGMVDRPARPARRRRLLAGAAAVLLILAAGAGLFVLARTPGAPAGESFESPAATDGTPAAQRGSLQVEGTGVLKRGDNIHVVGGPLDPRRSVRIFIQQGNYLAPIISDADVTVSDAGGIDEIGIVSTGLSAGPALVKACNLAGPGRVDESSCLSARVTLA